MYFNKKFEYTDLEAITDEKTGKRVYLTPDGIKLPSVTTILSATKDMTGLDNWRKRIGNDEADRQVKEAVNVGNLLHNELEKYILGLERNSGGNLIRKMARQMADNVINRGLIYVDEVWGVECALYYDGLYAGRSDLIGLYKGQPSIMDFKNSKKIKKREWIDDYMMQLVAYSMAHNNMFDTDIKQGVIFMAARDMTFETFVLEGNEFEKFRNRWIERLEQFFNL